MFQSAFIICAIWSVRPSLSGFDSPYLVTETVPEEPEPYDRVALKKYEELLGNLFAGQSEFPWILHVSVPFLSQYDAVGNLLTKFHVLITCTTLVHYELYLRKPADEGTRLPYYEGLGSIRITFASMFLQEYDRSPVVFRAPDSEKKLAGTRIPSWSVKHPECGNGRNYEYDFAILGLHRPIELLPPYITYAPIWRDPKQVLIPDNNNWLDLTNKRICWVAAWGRNYTNLQKPLTLGHKVKIRAYAYPDMHECRRIWNLLCPPDSVVDKDICFLNTPSDKQEGMICMYTRAQVGAVCDVNKGAPVVCDEEIYGLVMRAVPVQYCNSTNPLPFVAVNMHRIERGSPPLYSGALVPANKEGAAARFLSEKIILYTRGGCSGNLAGIPSFIFFLLALLCWYHWARHA